MTEQRKRPYRIEMTADELEAAEMALDRSTRLKSAPEATTPALDAIREAEEIDDEIDDVDQGRISSPSDVRAWDAHAASTNTPEGRRRNTEALQTIIDLHYPPHTEKGQH